MIGKKELLKKFKTLWEEVRNQKYAVYRGAVNWPNHNFEAEPYVVSVMMDECTFMKEINEGILSFEIFSRMTGVKNIDDEELDVQLENAMEVLYKMMGEKDSSARHICSITVGSENCVEHFDSSLNVQGLVIFVNIKF